MPEHIDTDAVIAQLNRLPRTHSALHVTMFKCFRETADGRTQEGASRYTTAALTCWSGPVATIA